MSLIRMAIIGEIPYKHSRPNKHTFFIAIKVNATIIPKFIKGMGFQEHHWTCSRVEIWKPHEQVMVEFPSGLIHRAVLPLH